MSKATQMNYGDENTFTTHGMMHYLYHSCLTTRFSFWSPRNLGLLHVHGHGTLIILHDKFR